ncbi:MAG: Cof-type HAD-IIB family hydrolase [Streptosporangiaceae bacterium]
MPPRLIATDLDGTLLRSDGTVSARTIAALALIEKAGSTLAMVTGRPPRWMRPIAQAVDHRGLAICANGAVLYDLHTEQIVRSHLIAVELLTEVVGTLREIEPDFRFAVEHGTGFVFEPRFNLGRWDADSLGGRPADLEALIGTPGTKLLALCPGADPDTLMAEVVKVLGDAVTVTHSSASGLLEISAPGVTKATALADLCTDLGLTAQDVAAFGDMPNDLPMLRWAGRSFAMANAHPDVLAVVTDHAAANNDDGVAQAIESLFG